MGPCRFAASTALVVSFLAGCGGTPSIEPTPPRPPSIATPALRAPTEAPPANAYYAPVFDRLATAVERNHAFAPERRAFWDAHKEALRLEMSAATSREAALLALRHMQNALGDRHCQLRAPSDLNPRRIKLGLELHAALVAGRPVVRVSKVADPALAPAIAVGDVIAAIDGVTMADYVASHPFESNALNPAIALHETADSAVSQVSAWSPVKENDRRVIRFERSGTTFERTLTFRRPFRYEKQDETLHVDDGPDMAKIGCTQSPSQPTPYAGYALDTVGSNVCVYRATDARAKRPVLVRFLSFMYELDHGDEDAALRALKVDHDLLVRALAKDDRVILDLHENHGGFNPFIFVSWFARSSWGHETVHVRVTDDFGEDDVRSFLWGDEKLVAQYAAARASQKTEIAYPFLCKSGSCDAVGPRKSELVTSKPVAVITGSECMSSCDAFSAMWSSFRLGPIVGKQPMHGFTSVRHAIPVTAPDQRDMGRFSIALSWEGFAGRPPLEGQPIALDWEAPETFETRTSWLDDAVAQATKRLASAR